LIILLPNLSPPLTTTDLVVKYRQHLISSLPNNVSEDESNDDCFKFLMTIYLTDNTTAEEIKKAHATGYVYAAKYYPAGATTNSAAGVTDVKRTYGALRAMEECGMVLCIHSEVARPDVDIFDREDHFIDEVMTPLVKDFPNLRMVMEHVSTGRAVDYVTSGQAGPNVRASITPHHLLYNRNALLVGGVRPHMYCLPILKRETHRLALLAAATSGSGLFFAGTDSAPHPTAMKESSCGCAGVYNAHAAVELYAEAFESVGALDKLDDFLSKYGSDHYGLSRNRCKITLVKKGWTVPKKYKFGEDGETITPLRAGETVNWSIL